MTYRDWGYDHAELAHTAEYLLPNLFHYLSDFPAGSRILDVGCGNGSFAGQYQLKGYRVVGVDLSQQGIDQARKAYPACRFEVLPADQHMLQKLGEHPFDVVISTEVVEHLYDPRSYAAGCFAALRPGGRFICSTPYHGYLKNLLLAVGGKWDSHLNPLWDGGHIKMWSRNTLSQLLRGAGFERIQFRGAGRLPYLWMSMVLSGDRPSK